jgi:hypothetical protein
MRKLAFLLVLFALPLSASWFEVSPASPTQTTPVSITFISEPTSFCNPTKAVTTRLGNDIRIVMTFDGDVCPADVNSRSLRVDVGALPAGEYKVTAVYENIHWNGAFVVRDATVLMNAVSTLGGTPVSLPFEGPAEEVLFGGTPATSMRVEDRLVVAVAPPHAPGLYDVAVKSHGNLFTQTAGVYYFDPSQPPDPTVFERVLFPILENTSGAFGSVWKATATIANPFAAYVETFNRIDQVTCIDRPCMELRPPQSTFDVSTGGYPHGAILYAPRGRLLYGLRIQETSRNDDPGVEIGAVRESRFSRELAMLANVPASSAYRTKIRIYGFDPLPSPYVQAAVIVDGNVASVKSIDLLLVRSGNPTEPAYAEFDLQTVLKAPAERATIVVSGPRFAPLWAMATAVHNSSQKLVVIASQ